MAEAPPLGRRERKKQQTRRALAEAGLRLFGERGYDAVTVAEIAEAADTALTTLFKHFPAGKKSLAFDGAVELEYGRPPIDRVPALQTALRERPAGSGVLDALEDFIAVRGPFDPERSDRWRAHYALFARTAEIRAYAREQWIRCEAGLTEALREAAGDHRDELELRTLARFVLETPNVALDREDPRAALGRIFDRLRAGWPEL